MAIPEVLLAYGAYKIYKSIKDDINAGKNNNQIDKIQEDKTDAKGTETVAAKTDSAQQNNTDEKNEPFSLAGMIK
ncbi:MAG: hypothetical protein IJ731_06720 [Eubacterium sp.]|nr:hypothetical protein [Eubacterium sp.]